MTPDPSAENPQPKDETVEIKISPEDSLSVDLTQAEFLARYREQQRRRHCPGCGESDEIL